MSRKPLIDATEVHDEIVSFLRLSGDAWIMERDIEKFISRLYEGKVSKSTSRRYVEKFLDGDDPRIRVGKSEDEHGRTVRVAKAT